MRKYLRSIAKANMRRLGYSKINRNMGAWRSLSTTEETDKAILKSLGKAFVQRFKIAEYNRAQERAKRRAERRKQRSTYETA